MPKSSTTPPTPDEFRAARLAAGLSRPALGRRWGVTRETMRRWETTGQGLKPWVFDALAGLAAAAKRCKK